MRFPTLYETKKSSEHRERNIPGDAVDGSGAVPSIAVDLPRKLSPANELRKEERWFVGWWSPWEWVSSVRATSAGLATLRTNTPDWRCESTWTLRGAILLLEAVGFVRITTRVENDGLRMREELTEMDGKIEANQSAQTEVRTKFMYLSLESGQRRSARQHGQ